MKTLKRLFILMLLAGAIVTGFIIWQKHGGNLEKVKTESKTAAASADDAVHNAVNTGKQMANKLATNAAAVTEEGMKKAGEMATNVAAKTKMMASNVVNKVTDVTTNVVNEARQKFGGATN